ncbi:MAG TPA: class I SAM-dependent methyltransferase, partial [Gemmataceae bacterium]|nr:class I SAM-dependent methyltransferase [Gemmataceae bacterium]
DLAPASFDRVTMWQSLEHVHDPLAVLRAAHRLLVPGGELLVAVPTIDSLAFRWFGPHWLGLDLPRHLTHFTPGTLGAMLLRAGFTVERVGRQRHSGWLRKSARRAGRRWLRRPFIARLAAACAHWAGRSDGLIVTARR